MLSGRFLRRLQQTRNGRTYTYYSLVESVRSPVGAVRQRTIGYLGRLDNLQPPDWRRIAERLPDPAWLPRRQQAVGYVPPPAHTGVVTTVAILPTSISWCRPRRLGDGYVALCPWPYLGRDRLRPRRLGRVATRVPMAVVAALIAVNRLVDPPSERGLFHWLPDTALPELLDVPLSRLTRNHLYRCLSLVEPHKQALDQHLADQGRDLFAFRNDLLRYDLTSTYCAGRLDTNPTAQRGDSRDQRPACKQRCIGRVVNREGFPLGQESLAGNRRDADTLLPMITALEGRCGVCPRSICFDRGMATAAQLRQRRQSQPPYLCATRRGVVRTHLPVIRSGPGTVVQTTHHDEPTIEVHQLPSQALDAVRQRGLLCRSAGCRRKEQQICDARLCKARARLAKLQQQVAAGTVVNRGVILAKARKAVGRSHDLQSVFTLDVQDPATGQQLHVQEKASALQDERDLQGVYLLRTTVADPPADDLWKTYMLLTRVEAAFRHLKTDLSTRPLYQHKQTRGDAHVLFAVLADALSVTIQVPSSPAWRGPDDSSLAGDVATAGLGGTVLSHQCWQPPGVRARRSALYRATRNPGESGLRYLPPDLEAEPRRGV